MAAVRPVVSLSVGILMFCTDEMKEQPPLLPLLGTEKEEESIESFYPRGRRQQGYCYRDLGRRKKQDVR